MTNSNNSLSNLEKGKFKITKSSSITKDTNADLLDILDLDNKIIDRNNLANAISINRYENGKNKINNGLPSGKLIIRGGKELVIDETKYSDILLEYKTILDSKPNNYQKRLEELDSILTERIILDSNNMIEFKYVDTFSGNKKAKEEAEIAYKQLNKLAEYKGKISLLSKKNGRFNDYYIIKLTEEEIKKIKEEPKEIEKQLTKEEILDLKNERAKLEEEYLQLFQAHINTKTKEEQTRLQNEITKNRNRVNEIDLILDTSKATFENLNEGKEEPVEEGKEEPVEEGKEEPVEEGKEEPVEEGKEVKEETVEEGKEVKEETVEDEKKDDDMNKEIKNIDEKMEQILKLINMIDINNQYNKLSQRREKLKKHMEDFDKDGSINADTELFKAIYPALEHEINEFKKDLENAIIDIKDKVALIDGSGIADLEKVKKIKKELEDILAKYEAIKIDFDSMYKKLLERIYKKTPKQLPPHEEEEVIPKPIIPDPKPEPKPDPEKTEDLELSAVISDMGTDVHRERVSLETEEELRAQYKATSRWNVGKKGYLFLSRGKKRKKMIKEKMGKLSGKAFSLDNSLDEKTGDASDRHELELEHKLDKVNQENTVALENPQINQLCKDYLEGKITEDNFKILFNQYVDADANIQNVLKNAKLPEKKKITHIGTNILEKLKLQKASGELMSKVNTEFEQYINNKQNSHIDNINKLIEDYIKQYQQNPKFLGDYQEFLSNKDPSKLKLFFKHNEAVMKMQIKNLKVKIDIVTQGKSAYQIDNKDRQKGRAYKVGHALDKLPRWVQTAGFVGLSIGTGLLTGGLGTVASAARVTGVSAGSVGGLNALKKWTHYTKEQNTHEKNVATDYRNEQKKIQERQDQALKGKRYSWKTYKAKRQLALYDQSTQENFQISNTITDTITDLCSQVRKLTPQEENYIKKNLIQGKVRLDYYRDIGHNFLASNEKDKIERDMKRLEKSIILGTSKLGIALADITSLQATDDTGTNLKYDDVKKDLENSYNKSLIQFKRERRVLAAKYGVGTAVASAGMSLGMQYFMGTGVFGDKVVPGTTTGTGTTENFDMGKYDLLDTGTSNNIHDTAMSISSNPNINSSSVIDIHYGAGTDATAVLPGRLTESVYDTKINQVINNINGMKGLNSTIRDQLIDHVKSEPRKSNRATSNFTNDFLHGMRCAETVEQAARGLADSGYSHGIKIAYDSSYDIVGTSMRNVAERVVNADFVLNNPGTGNSRWERLAIPVPLFFNTFKDKILGKKLEDKKPEAPNKPEDKPKSNKDGDIDVGDINPYKPDPVDPTKDPDGFYKDDIGSKKNDDSFKGKTKKITTRGQKIDQIDKSDYGKEYPGDGKLQSEKTTAYDILRVKKLLTQQDLGEITQMQKNGATNDDILKYLEDRVKMQREGAKEKSKKRAFEKILNECYDKIPQYLKKFLPKYADKLNLLPDANRIHLVGEYDYLSIAGPGSSGVFRSESGDIYISQKAIEQFENAPALGSIDKGSNQVSTFPRIYWEIKHIMVHEMLHSMSILNYKDNNKDNETLMRHIGTRRLGLLNINYKNGKMRGYGINEGTTEWLAQFILENRYHDEGLLNYKAPRVAYQQEQDIISKIIKVEGDNIKREDFYKAMLLRKYGDEKNVEFKTPLFELVSKINGWTQLKEGDKKIPDKRPHYYQLVMSLMDYVNDKNLNNIGFILEFIEKKDISILKNHFGSTLDAVFDKTLLNKNKTDFNQTILDGYSGKIK